MKHDDSPLPFSPKTGGRLGIALLVVAGLVLLSRLVPGVSGDGPGRMAGEAARSAAEAARGVASSVRDSAGRVHGAAHGRSGVHGHHSASTSSSGVLSREIALAPAAVLGVVVDAADVVVTEGRDGSGAVVTAILRRDATPDDVAWTVDASDEATTVRLESTRKRRGFASWFGGGREASIGRVEVALPPGHAITLKTGAGDVTLDPIDADAEVTTGAGDVQAARVGGFLKLRTGAGDVNAAVAGGAELDTGAGDVELTVEAGRVTTRTGAGEVMVRVLGQAEGVDAKTGIGSIEVELPGTASFTLDAVSGLGSVSLQLPGQEPTRTTGPSGRLERSVGSGGPRIDLKTGAGSIDVHAGLDHI